MWVNVKNNGFPNATACSKNSGGMQKVSVVAM
jgi:hypothetical protein